MVAQRSKRGRSEKKRSMARARRARKKDARRREMALSKGATACARKRRYPTRRAAELAAAACEFRRDVRLSVYRCDTCGGWHLTSHPRGEADAS